jgi:hypothetical protein
MRHLQGKLALAGLLFVCAALASAADDPKQYRLNEEQPLTGSMLKHSGATGNLPYDKRYEDMTPEQRALVKAAYEPMPDADEPPFPADGLGPMMKAFHKGANAYEPRGEIDMAVEVGPDGVGRSVQIYKTTDDPKFTRFAAGLLMFTKYKPAVCGGRPCTMWYPLHVHFTVDYLQ